MQGYVRWYTNGYQLQTTYILRYCTVYGNIRTHTRHNHCPLTPHTKMTTHTTCGGVYYVGTCFVHKVDMDDVVFLTVYIQIPLHPTSRCCCPLLTLFTWALLLSTVTVYLCCNIFLPTVDASRLIHKYVYCIMTKCLTT